MYLSFTKSGNPGVFVDICNMTDAENFANQIRDLMKSRYNEDGLFKHAKTGIEFVLTFEGSDPMRSQDKLVELFNELMKQENLPVYVYVNTVGSVAITEEMRDFLHYYNLSSEFDGYVNDDRGPTLWYWKVTHVSGITDIEVVARYSDANDRGSIAFMINGNDMEWYDMELKLEEYKKQDVNWVSFVKNVPSAKQDEIIAEALVRGTRMGE